MKTEKPTNEVESTTKSQIVIPRISHFIDENKNTVDINEAGVNVRLNRNGMHEYWRSYGFAGVMKLTPVYTL